MLYEPWNDLEYSGGGYGRGERMVPEPGVGPTERALEPSAREERAGERMARTGGSGMEDLGTP